MNKIKLMYDIARVMRDQDNLDGTLKDEQEIFRMNNEFSRNFTSGSGKAKISTVMDHEGKQLQHESTTEFNRNPKQDNELPGCKIHGFLHKHHCGTHGAGIKKKLDIVIAALIALNDMEILEQEDKGMLLSLDLNKIPEDLQQTFRNRMLQKHHARPGFLQGCPVMEKGRLECRINKNYAIEAITSNWEGKLQEENQMAGSLILDAAAVFAR